MNKLKIFSHLSKSLFSAKLFNISKIFQQKHQRTKTTKSIFFLPFSLMAMSAIFCVSKEDHQQINDNLQSLTMQQLVKVLHQKPQRQFVVIVYDKFQKNNNPISFANQLKKILQECKKSNVLRIYTISSLQQKYIREIVRRLNNHSVQKQEKDQSSDKQTKQKKKILQCYFKSKGFPEAFQLLNNTDYCISQQINEIRHCQVKINNQNIESQLNSLDQFKFDINKNLVIKQCIGEGECVQSFKRDVAQLIDSGMLIKKGPQYQFQIVVDYPTGLLNKSTEYIKKFYGAAQKFAKRPLQSKKQETYLFRRDILGKQTKVFSESNENVQINLSSYQKMMMFIRPRVNIISKCNTFTELQWYFMTNQFTNSPSLSLNNTEAWIKTNSLKTLQVIKLLYKYHPKLNFLIINTSSAGDIIKHVHANYKYVIFQPSRDAIWNKLFLDIDQLQKIQNKEARQQAYKTQFNESIEYFIKNPIQKDLVSVEKELQISFNKLKNLRDRQIRQGTRQPQTNYIIRVCEQRCHRFLKEQTINRIQNQFKQKTNVYWIDCKNQNIGVQPGDYILKSGQLINLIDFLSKQQSK